MPRSGLNELKPPHNLHLAPKAINRHSDKNSASKQTSYVSTLSNQTSSSSIWQLWSCPWLNSKGNECVCLRVCI